MSSGSCQRPRHQRPDLLGRPRLVAGPIPPGLAGGPGLVDRAVQRRPDHAGVQRVDPDVVRRQVPGGALGEVDQARLGRAVGRVGLRADLAGDGCQEQERARPRRGHRRGEGVGDVDGAAEVDPQDAVPVSRVQRPEREAELARADPRGEGHVVAAAEVAPDPLGHPPDRREVGDVGDERRGPRPAGRRQLPGDGGGIGVAVEDRHGRSLGQECGGDGPPQAPRPADHHRDVPRQLQVHGRIIRGSAWRSCPAGRPATRPSRPCRSCRPRC